MAEAQRARDNEAAAKREQSLLQQQAAVASELAELQRAKAASIQRWLAGAILLVLIAIVLWFRASTAESEAVTAKNAAVIATKEAVANFEAAEKAKGDALKQENLAQRTLYAAKIQFADSAWELGDVAKARLHLDEAQWNLRGWEHDYLHQKFEGTTLRGHLRSVNSVNFSPDGTRIVSGSDDRTLKVWDAATGQETLTLNGHSGLVSCVSFSPNGNSIVSGSFDKTLKVWDAATGQETLTLKGHSDGVLSMSFSPDGKRIVSGGGRFYKPGELKVWDAATGQQTLTLKGHSDSVTSVSFSPDGKRIVCGSGDKTLKLWDAATGQVMLTLKGDSGWVHSVSFSPDGKRIVGSSDKTLKVWDAATGQETLTLKGHSDAVGSVSFSRDGQRIVSGSYDKTLKLWDAATGQKTLTVKGYSESVHSVRFSSDGKRIVSGGGQRDDHGRWRQMLAWDAVTGLPLQPDASDAELLKADSPSTTRIYDRVVETDEDANKLIIKRVSTGEVLFTGFDHDGVMNPSFSPDGMKVVSLNRDGKVKVWLQAARSAPAKASAGTKGDSGKAANVE